RSVGLSVCRSVGLSVCRSVGLSVCRSVGLSVCRSVGLSVIILCAVWLSAADNAHAQWKWDAPNLNVSDTSNWINGEVNFHFYYTGTEITYNLGELKFTTLGDNPFLSELNDVNFSAAGIDDIASIKGYRLSGYGLYPTEFVANALATTVIGGTTYTNYLALGRQTTQGNTYWPYTGTTSSGDYTISNYGPDTVIAGMSFTAGATTLYTGTYDARQLPLGTLITGAGIADGTYVRGVTSSGAIIISKATTEASDGDYIVTGYRSYSKNIGNLTYSGEVEVPQDFAYLNNYNGGYINGSGKLVFTDPNAMFISANGPASDAAAFQIYGTLEFSGNATFAAGHGVYLPYSNGAAPPAQGKARLSTSNNTIYLNATVNVAGNFTKIGPDSLVQSGGATANLILDGGKIDLLDGFWQPAYSGQNLTAARIQGASAINIARQSLSSENGTFPFLFLNATQINAAQSGTVNLLENNLPINLFTGAIGAQGLGANEQVSGQSVGDVYLQSGHNAVGVVTGNLSTVNGFALTLKSLNRLNGATVALYGIGSTFANATNVGRLLVQNDDNIVSALVGGTGGENYGATNIEILPWAAANNSTNTNVAYSGNVNDFVTYVSGSGFRWLAANEYRVGWGGADGDNVRIDTAAALTGNATINALKLSAGGNIGINGALTIASGAIILTANPTLNGSGTIFTGNNPLIIRQNNNSLVIDTGVVVKNTVSGTDPGLIVAASTQLKSPGEFGGAVLIQGGAQFQVSNITALSEANAVRIDAASKLLVDASSVRVASLAGTGYVLFNNAAYKLSVGEVDLADSTGYVTVHKDGIVAPGDVSGPMQASALYFGKNITGVEFQEDSMLKLDLGANGLSDMLAVYTAEYDANRNISNPWLTFEKDAIIQFNFLDGYTISAGDQWLLSTGFANVDLNAGVLLQDSQGADLSEWLSLGLSGNNLILTAVPEPGTWALLLIGGVILLATRRRRRAER
ncbi:MAG: PEP-CTERM sorting domain-containing protein, partial [Verrucomicrobiales bacterium]|nr:PEP-CTERM sorting domain-containing protein [Verrucomicrobiales bacterium]